MLRCRLFLMLSPPCRSRYPALRLAEGPSHGQALLSPSPSSSHAGTAVVAGLRVLLVLVPFRPLARPRVHVQELRLLLCVFPSSCIASPDVQPRLPRLVWSLRTANSACFISHG